MKKEEESLKRIEKAAAKGARRGRLLSWIITSLLPIVIGVVVLSIIMNVMLTNASNMLHDTISSIPQAIKEQFSFEDPADSHDKVLENHGILGYTAADFEEAILGEQKQLRKIEVYESKVSDAVTLTETGLANLAIFTKSQVITYNGIATYTVDLSKLTKDSVILDETHKTVKLLIPHAELGVINIPSSGMEFSDTEHGRLAFGEIKLSADDLADVQTEASGRMEKKLEELNEKEKADRFAKLSVWEIYQPIVSAVSAEYKLEVEFE